jgi:hypothetical protein
MIRAGSDQIKPATLVAGVAPAAWLGIAKP